MTKSPLKMATQNLLRLLLFFLSLRPLFSTHHHRRRLLHQPFQPQASSPPSKPPIPSPPKYPFSNSTPADPFFPSFPTSPPQPPSSQASFPANVSSLTVPRSSGPHSASSKLIVAAIAAVVSAVAVVSLAAFLHIRRRARTRRSSSFDRSKTHRSDSSSTVSFSNHLQHIPKLQRPPQTSSEFLYLGTLVSSHAPGAAAAFNNVSTTSTANNHTNPSTVSRKTDSPELRPLPPLNPPQVFRADSGGAANVESEEFYSPRESSIGTGSASRRTFTAVDVENFNESNSSTCSSAAGSGPGSPAKSASSRSSISESPYLIEIQTITSSSSSPENYSRKSAESSPRISEYNSESQSPVIISTAIPTPPEIRDTLFPEPELPLSYSRRSEESESSPRNSRSSDVKLESPVSSSSPVNSLFPTPPETEGLFLPEPPPSSSSPERYPKSPPRIPTDSDPDITIEFPIPPPPETQVLTLQESASCSTKFEQSSPRNSNADSPERIALTISTLTTPPPQMQNSEFHDQKSPSCLLPLPEKYSTSKESSPRVSVGSDPKVESPVKIQHNVISSIPSPPPLPPSKLWGSPKTPTQPAKKPLVPPGLINPLRPISLESPASISPMLLPDPQMDGNGDEKEYPNKETEYSREDVDKDEDGDTFKPKLKQLHWDKVRASSDREMVWDQFKSSSFKLNEEMIETLFVANTPKPKPSLNEATRWQVLPPPGQDNGNRVLDPKKSQNIAILLKALHVTVDEVCEGLLEGNWDILGTDLLESLLKMAPSKEEERKLQEYKEEDNDSPTKLGPAERFLKAVVDIPHAFKRVNAMLYISNFDSEVEYLKKSFATLGYACEELRSSRMFLKLLEAVLKTGNRMNVGTNRGDAHAFKLDTLLKLADVKAGDGKTTLLHFVVQEMVRSEGLRVVSSLSSELSNVKKAAAMDAEVLSADVAKLSKGMENVREMVGDVAAFGGGGDDKFVENMGSFMRRGEEEIFRVRAEESLGLSLVKEITEYFHGDSGKEEAHPFRIFVVVKEFLGVLERVCKEVGMVNERTVVSSAHTFPVPVNPMMQQQASGMFSID